MKKIRSGKMKVNFDPIKLGFKDYTNKSLYKEFGFKQATKLYFDIYFAEFKCFILKHTVCKVKGHNFPKRFSGMTINFTLPCYRCWTCDPEFEAKVKDFLDGK